MWVVPSIAMWVVPSIGPVRRDAPAAPRTLITSVKGVGVDGQGRTSPSSTRGRGRRDAVHSRDLRPRRCPVETGRVDSEASPVNAIPHTKVFGYVRFERVHDEGAPTAFSPPLELLERDTAQPDSRQLLVRPADTDP